jgi:hypothetical protein
MASRPPRVWDRPGGRLKSAQAGWRGRSWAYFGLLEPPPRRSPPWCQPARLSCRRSSGAAAGAAGAVWEGVCWSWWCVLAGLLWSLHRKAAALPSLWPGGGGRLTKLLFPRPCRPVRRPVRPSVTAAAAPTPRPQLDRDRPLRNPQLPQFEANLESATAQPAALVWERDGMYHRAKAGLGHYLVGPTETPQVEPSASQNVHRAIEGILRGAASRDESRQSGRVRKGAQVCSSRFWNCTGRRLH